MFKKIIINTILILFSLTGIWAFNINLNFPSNINYETYTCNPGESKSNCTFNLKSTGVTTFYESPTTYTNRLYRTYSFKTNYRLQEYTTDVPIAMTLYSTEAYTYPSSAYTGYRDGVNHVNTDYTTSQTTCQPTIDTTYTNTLTSVSAKANLKPYPVSAPAHLLQQYYWMKVIPTITVVQTSNQGTTGFTSQTFQGNPIYLQDVSKPFTYTTTFNKDQFIKDRITQGQFGTYDVQLTLDPNQEPKCTNGGTSSTSVVIDSFKVFDQYLDSDNDGILDWNLDGTQRDMCPTVSGDKLYMGCPKYTLSGTCNTATQTSFQCNHNRGYVKLNGVQKTSGYSYDSVSVGSPGNYECWDSGNWYTADYQIYMCTYTQNPQITIDTTYTQDYTNRYFEVNDIYNVIKFKDSTGIDQTVNVPTVNTTNKKRVLTYQNGVLTANETVDPIKIAKVAHKIKNLKNVNEAETFINESTRLMEKFDIIKNLTFDGVNTKVEIKLQDIPVSSQNNITIYQVIPKSVASSSDQITFINDGGGQRFISDKDPIIGWYFNDSGSSGSVTYQVPGNNEGGTIVVTQEPILFNEGELIVNYRQTDCNAGEATLFELDDLVDSKVYTAGTGALYKVCLAHITETLIEGTSLSNDVHVFNFTNGANMSFNNLPTYINSVDASVNRNDILWDVRISENNPTGNYSCIGSINNEDSSLLGDCGYTNKRIWMHLGVDMTPPTTNVDAPYSAHTVTATLTATDNIGGAGVKSLTYCVDEANSCTPNTVVNSDSKVLTVSCPQDWGCLKYVRMFATDNQGNVGTVESYPLKMLDKGSACQSDCTAKPSPNRFLKECRNLNGCEYAATETESGDSKGETVANLCDLLIPGAYVKYNATHEIMCPQGPYRESRFLDTKTELTSEANTCKDLITYDIPVLFEGESVIMKIISCIKNY